MIRIRTLKESEVETILSLRRKFFGEFFEERFRNYVKKNPGSIIIADNGEDDSEILGYAFAYPWQYDTGVVHHIFAAPDYKNVVQNRLLNHLENYFAEKGIKKIRVWAREEQKNLIKLLYTFGYELDTELLVFENDGLEAISMADEGNKSIEVRDFEGGFIENIMEIEAKCFKPSWHQRKEDFFAYAKRPDSWFCVALDLGKAVGYLQVSASGDLGYYGRVAVLPRYQRKGIGTRLSAMAIKWFKAKGTKKIKLRSPIANTPAHKLYRKFGFREVGKEYDFVKS